MARSNGGIIGKVNKTSFGKCRVTTTTSTGSTTLTMQPGTRFISATIIAGGGSGGRGDVGGGAGAGGVLCVTAIPVCGPIPITVGGGGAAQPSCACGVKGTDSTLVAACGTQTAVGGGKGGGGAWTNPCRPGGPGGSGGGAGNLRPNTGGSGTACQGNDGSASTSPPPQVVIMAEYQVEVEKM